MDAKYEALKQEARRLRVIAKDNPHDEDAHTEYTRALNAMAQHSIVTNGIGNVTYVPPVHDDKEEGKEV